MPVLLGAIADDFTGATDSPIPWSARACAPCSCSACRPGQPLPDVDAVVVALKSRTAPADEAIRESLGALAWLRAAEPAQIYFKYCSTFDSTERGNIGPVADALLAALGQTFSVACPAFPENGRTVYNGHLYVGRDLLSESSMRNHPLTPMTDANLVRVLARQCGGKVDLVPYGIVRQGAEAIRREFDRLRGAGTRYAILDAVEDPHLFALGAACADMGLVTGGSGMALGLPENFRRAGLLASAAGADLLPAVGGSAAVVAGSCSAATLAQIDTMRRSRPAFEVDPLALARGEAIVARALDWARPLLSGGPVLIYCSAPPAAVAAVQQTLGREHAGTRWNRRWQPSHAAWSLLACAAWSSPAARRPVPSSMRSA